MMIDMQTVSATVTIQLLAPISPTFTAAKAAVQAMFLHCHCEALLPTCRNPVAAPSGGVRGSLLQATPRLLPAFSRL